MWNTLHSDVVGALNFRSRTVVAVLVVVRNAKWRVDEVDHVLPGAHCTMQGAHDDEKHHCDKPVHQLADALRNVAIQRLDEVRHADGDVV